MRWPASNAPEQTGVVARTAVDEQVGDDMAVALEVGAEVVVAVADGLEAGAAVVVGVVAVADAARVGGTVAVGVEVQVRLQLVAGAASPRAAHVGAAVGERLVVQRRVRRRGAVAVEVPAHGVQLREVAHLDQAVVVAVVVAALQPRVHAAPGQRRVLAARAEVPRRLGRIAVAVQVQAVPAGVHARRRHGALQGAGRQARAPAEAAVRLASTSQ